MRPPGLQEGHRSVPPHASSDVLHIPDGWKDLQDCTPSSACTHRMVLTGGEARRRHNLHTRTPQRARSPGSSGEINNSLPVNGPVGYRRQECRNRVPRLGGHYWRAPLCGPFQAGRKPTSAAAAHATPFSPASSSSTGFIINLCAHSSFATLRNGHRPGRHAPAAP